MVDVRFSSGYLWALRWPLCWYGGSGGLGNGWGILDGVALKGCEAIRKQGGSVRMRGMFEAPVLREGEIDGQRTRWNDGHVRKDPDASATKTHR